MHWPLLEGRRVAVLGYGREGAAACRVLLEAHTDQRITLFCPESEARAAQTAIGARLDWRPWPCAVDALLGFDLLIKSPGISPYLAPLAALPTPGPRLTSGTSMWLDAHAHQTVISVTGTKGKSTTTSLIAHLLRASGERTALAGNIGLPLLDLPDDRSVSCHVVELSSFHCADLNERPRFALVTNVIEEHLDWHGSVARYVQDKLRIIADDGSNTVVLNALDPILRRYPQRPNTVWYGQDQGWHVAAGHVCRGARRVLPVLDIPLPGAHNALNLCGALAVIEAAGFDAEAMAPLLAGFVPLPHRLQLLGTRDGIRYINDSIATTPQAAVAALDDCAGPVAILVGGHERGLDWASFVAAVRARPEVQVVTMAANGPRIADCLRAAGLSQQTWTADTLESAFALARDRLRAGGSLLLSPGAPSFGAFRDYTERGRMFAALAGFDPQSINQIEGLGIR